jgi:DNA-binding FrmR family transcriptional regulator
MNSKTSRWIAVIVVLQIVTIIGQLSAVPGATPAYAQVPDAGAQQNEVITQLRATNEKLDKLVTLLSGGNLQVRVAKADDNSGR